MARRLLLDEYALYLLPTLAVVLGVNEALILQQFNYWIQGQGNDWEGYFWTFNSYTEWRKQFPFFSKETIGRAIRRLEARGLVVSKVGPNKKKFDRTKWYRIDYDKFDELFPERLPERRVNVEQPSQQVDTMVMSDRHDADVNLTSDLSSPTHQSEPTIPEKNTTETSARTSTKKATSKIKKQSFEDYIEELRSEFPDLNFDAELKKFNLYWSEGNRKLKRPKLALLNWLNKAREIQQEKNPNQGALFSRSHMVKR